MFTNFLEEKLHLSKNHKKNDTLSCTQFSSTLPIHQASFWGREGSVVCAQANEMSDIYVYINTAVYIKIYIYKGRKESFH